MVAQLKNFLLATDKTAEENVPAALSAFMAAYDNKQDFMRYMVRCLSVCPLSVCPSVVKSVGRAGSKC